MNHSNASNSRDQLVSRYVRALDGGDMEMVGQVLEIAETDSVLDQIIAEINFSIADELGLSGVSAQVAQVSSLLHEHLASAFTEAQEDAPILVSEVTAHLVAERKVPDLDQEKIWNLLHIQLPLPKRLSLPEIRKFSQQFGVSVSERFLKVFRDTAIQMSMGRGEAQMAATRRKQGRSHGAGGHTNEDNHGSK